MHPYTKKVLGELTVALNVFGTYQFDDKGPGEVMDIHQIAENIENDYSAEEAGDILVEVSRAKTHDGRSETVANDIAYYLQHWDALFDHPNVDEFYG